MYELDGGRNRVRAVFAQRLQELAVLAVRQTPHGVASGRVVNGASNQCDTTRSQESFDARVSRHAVHVPQVVVSSEWRGVAGRKELVKCSRPRRSVRAGGVS